MNPDAAKEALKKARQEGALARRLGAGSGKLGPIKKLVGKAAKENSSYGHRRVINEHEGGVGPLFEKLSEKERLRLIKTLLPRLKDSIDAAWVALARRPYQRGEYRKPFRCPGSEADLRERRGKWLLHTTLTLGEYDHDIEWVASWSAHIADWYNATELGWLLAGALDLGGSQSDAVFEVLKASASGEHEVGQMGRHITQAFMSSSRPEAWEFNEKLLLAAQRQEGLRQTILESIDESHPEAFRRMLRLILEHNLTRFSSVVRAVDTWFGFMWDGESGFKVGQVLEQVLELFDDSEKHAATLAGEDAEAAYLALWTLAFEDVERSIEPAYAMLESKSAEKRFVATHFLAQTLWMPTRARLIKMLDDTDLRVAARALFCFQSDTTNWVDSIELFEALERLLPRLKKRSQSLESIVWPWWSIKLERPTITQAMTRNSSGVPTDRLLPYVRDMDPHRRESFVRELAGLRRSRWSSEKSKKPKRLTGRVYDTVLDLLGDASPDVRGTAFKALASTPIQPLELARLCKLLNRKSGDLRNRCIERLRSAKDEVLFSVIDELLAEKDRMRRLAGLELLRSAVEADRSADRARHLAMRYQEENGSLPPEESAHLQAILVEHVEVATLDDALGLVDPTQLVEWERPVKRKASIESKAAGRCVESLISLIFEHQDTEVCLDNGETVLLMNVGWGLRGPDSPERASETESRVPLVETWRSWCEGRGEELRDADGLELVRACLAGEGSSVWGGKKAQKLLSLDRRWDFGSPLVSRILEWCIYWERPPRTHAFLLDILETQMSELTAEDFAEMRAEPKRRWRSWREKATDREKRVGEASRWHTLLRRMRVLLPDTHNGDDAYRLYGLLRWFQLESFGQPELQPILREAIDFYRSGRLGSNRVDEILDLLVGRCSDQPAFRLVSQVTGYKPTKELEEFPELQDAIDRMRRRVVEVECQRGDRATAASFASGELRWSGGLEAVTQAMQSLGRTKFARSYSWGDTELSRKDTLSNIVLRSTPRSDDSVEQFAEWAREAKLPEVRLVELAAYSPQWVSHVNHVLEWPGLASAVWWIHAHTKDDHWRLGDLRDLWAAQVGEQTPLTADDLTEGAVDVDWFHQAYSELGKERWEKLYQAAKFASSSGGHKRAQLFASAMLATVSPKELLAKVDEKRHQDSVRALGLLPLPKGKSPDAELLARYARLQEFKRESRQFGSQRQQSEGRAVTIGMENLARTAGYKDPLRLQWAMEKEAIKDLIAGPVVVQRDDVTVALSIDEEGSPEIKVQRKDRQLKSVPAKLRKDEGIVELRARAKDLKRQASRVKGALEEAMCRGDVFEGAELQGLLEHPVLAPSLSRLLFIGDDIIGFPVKGGLALEDGAGKLEPVRKHESLRVAHPHDLLDRGDWSDWQRDCFQRERVQPFKQIFRELYPMTETERSDKKRSRRFAGHQVNPRQALALLGGRGWLAQPEEGVNRTFHEEGLTARLAFEESFYTPADVEGLTLAEVIFTKKGEWKRLDLEAIPPRVFSETMRDVDLVVSVAHQGGVDPEATASTIEMRAALIRESSQLLGLDNVEVKQANVIVRGQLGQYTVHLGSAVASMFGGLSLVIVAVHSQHRGRLFLPFADDDPRTAEVLSKVLLLARDNEIQDPNILDQIRRAQR